jgi:hypothetical protein
LCAISDSLITEESPGNVAKEGSLPYAEQCPILVRVEMGPKVDACMILMRTESDEVNAVLIKTTMAVSPSFSDSRHTTCKIIPQQNQRLNATNVIGWTWGWKTIQGAILLDGFPTWRSASC